ncbi:MAG: hypothetical protein Tsb0020_25370 [Haliangiales bacterium]
MFIYEPIGSHDYECAVCDREDDWDVFHSLDGSPRLPTWQPINVHLCAADEHQRALRSDFPWLSSDVLVFRKRALMALKDIVDAHGEVLTIYADDGSELFALNACVIDALDESKSEVMLAPDTGEILFVEKVAFIESRIRGFDIFRLPYRANPTYVSQRFIDRVQKSKLIGLDFEKVWPVPQVGA